VARRLRHQASGIARTGPGAVMLAQISAPAPQLDDAPSFPDRTSLHSEEGFKAQVAPYITRLPLEEERDGQALSVL
jgi:hypothetical protein